mmetsp:Transcript_29457/g.28330  ORF Transcript_29457/g.28330 Transcript_29457/m.28330 type:complete len:181 (+) Transcript_29457:1694-2236(+)
MGRPQTTNQNYDFNFTVADAMKLAETRLRKGGYQVTFFCCTNDGLSCDDVFVLEILMDFFSGRRNFTALTDTNHNVKSCRYQLIIGRNNSKTIGMYVIDGGLLKKIPLEQELIRPKDFASDLLVLRLDSVKTVKYILTLECPDQHSQVILSLSLMFMRSHLFAVNSRGALTAKERISMLW